MQFSRFHNIIKSNEKIPKFLIITKISLRTLHSFINSYKNSFCTLKPNLQPHTCGTHAYCMCNKTRLFCLYLFFIFIKLQGQKICSTPERTVKGKRVMAGLAFGCKAIKGCKQECKQGENCYCAYTCGIKRTSGSKTKTIIIFYIFRL